MEGKAKDPVDQDKEIAETVIFDPLYPIENLGYPDKIIFKMMDRCYTDDLLKHIENIENILEMDVEGFPAVDVYNAAHKLVGSVRYVGA